MAGKAIRAGEAFLELRVRDQAFNRGISNAIQRLQTFGRTLSGIGTGSFIGLSGFQRALFALAGSSALGWPVKLAANLELLTAQLSVFTGSAGSARTVLLDLQKFASVAFQDFERLVTQMRLLMTRGASTNESLADIKALATVAAGSADEFEQLVKAFADVRSATRLNGEEMRQFKNTAFNPFIEISKRTGETMDEVRQRMEAGGISFNEVRRALHDTVGPGGLFNGMLEKIAATLTGRLRTAINAFKVAILPLGEEVLPLFSAILDKINVLIPVFGKFIKQNKGIATVVAVITGAVVGFLGVMTGLGLIIQLVSFALAGLAAAFSKAASPIVLIIALIAALIVAFLRFTSIGQQIVAFLAGKFRQLGQIASDTFSGMADAMAAGDVAAAAEVMWAGLALAWQEGTHELEGIWLDFKDMFLRTTTEMVFNAQSLFLTLSTELQSIWADMLTSAKTIGEKIGHFLTRSEDPELAKDQDDAHRERLNQIEREGRADENRIRNKLKNELDAIEQNRNLAEEDRNRLHNDAINKHQQELRDARKRFDEARKRAADARKKGEGGLNAQFHASLDGISGTAAITGTRSTFSGALAGQIFGAGGPDQIPRKQLIELQKANRNLEKLQRRQAFRMRVGRG